MTHEIGKAGHRENDLIREVKGGIPHRISDVAAWKNERQRWVQSRILQGSVYYCDSVGHDQKFQPGVIEGQLLNSSLTSPLFPASLPQMPEIASSETHLCKEFPWPLGGGTFGYCLSLKQKALVCQILPGQLQREEIWGVGGEEGRSIWRRGAHSAQVWRWEKENQVRTKMSWGLGDSTRSLVPRALTLTWVLIRGALDILYDSVSQLAKLISSLHPSDWCPQLEEHLGQEGGCPKCPPCLLPPAELNAFLEAAGLLPKPVYASGTCYCNYAI